LIDLELQVIDSCLIMGLFMLDTRKQFLIGLLDLMELFRKIVLM